MRVMRGVGVFTGIRLIRDSRGSKRIVGIYIVCIARVFSVIRVIRRSGICRVVTFALPCSIVYTLDP